MTGLDLTHKDDSVRPQDDFFRYCNGRWIDTAKIDDDKAVAGVFIDLRDAAEQNVKAILESLEDDGGDGIESRLARLFASFMAEEAIEAVGAGALVDPLKKIAEIVDSKTFAAYLGWATRHNLGGAFSLSEDADPGNSSRYALFIRQAGLGLPDEEYYRLDEHFEIRSQYLSTITKLFELAGLPKAEEQAQTVLEVETKLAAHHWDKVRCRDIVAMFNPMSYEELAQRCPGFDWDVFAQAAALPAEKTSYLILSQPSFLEDFASLVNSLPLAHWRCWARWHVIVSLASYLSSDFVDAKFDFYGRILSGSKENRPRWARAVAFVESVMGEAVGKLYVAQHFKEEEKAKMDTLVANLIEAYRNSISNLDWMSEATRAQALEKLAGFRPKIGYRNNFRTYDGLQVGSVLVENLLASREFEFNFMLSKLLEPVDPDEWFMLPQTVNAYYHSLRNEIVFPAAILQPPFFTVTADDAVNYGAIGAVIGHEIGHGFDDKGSTTDAQGNIRDWWSAEDRQAFTERTSKLVDQFDGLRPAGVDGEVNGHLTLGENIGDLGGASIAYKAWLLAGGNPDGEKIDGFTPAQRFFLGYGQIWRNKRRLESAKMCLSIDPHSPPEFRVNQILRNIDSFYEAFHLGPEDKLWLDPEQRVTIW